MSRDEKFITLFVFVIFFLWACKNRIDNFEAPPAVHYDTLVDQIKAQAKPRESFITVSKVRWHKFPNADISFIEGVMRRSVKNNDTLPADTASVYHVYDFRELDTLFFFSISRCDPGQFVSLYHFTLDKVTGELYGCTLIGSGRKAPGHTLVEKLSYSRDGRSLIVNSTEERTEEKKLVIDKCSVRFDFGKDSTWNRLLHNAHKEKEIAEPDARLSGARR
jgi:hypothetical protein